LLFCFCDLDLDLYEMTLIQELDLDVLKMHLHTENRLFTPRLSKDKALQTDTQTDATENIITPHLRLVKICTVSVKSYTALHILCRAVLG